jgi:hypothetical protein
LIFLIGCNISSASAFSMINHILQRHALPTILTMFVRALPCFLRFALCSQHLASFFPPQVLILFSLFQYPVALL